MDYLDKKFQEKISEKRIRSRLTAVGIVLSLVLGMFLPYFETLSASAVSNGNWDDGVNYMESAITQAHGFNLANNIDNVSFTIGDTTYSSDGTGAVTVKAGSDDPVAVMVNMEYKFTREQLLESGILTNGGYVYYQMNANIKIENPIFGVGRYVTDASWSTTEPAGYYSIDSDGLITIRYTQAYLNHLKTSNDVIGTLNFNGKIQRKDGESGDKNFDFGKVDVTVEFDDITPQIKKDYQDVRGEDSSHDLVWTITIENPGGVVQMENYTLTDFLDGSPVEWTDATIEPEGIGTFGADGTVSFTHQDNPPETITIKYTTNNAATNTKYENVAKLQKGDETPIEAKKEATIEDALEVSKYGQADYELETSMKDRIKWTINVRHKASDSLRNVVVTEDSAHPFDQAYESATSNNYGSTYVQVIDKATGQTIDSSKYTINGNTLTFNDDSSIPSEVDIVFWTQETIPTQTEEINNGNDSSTVSPVAQDVSNSVSAGREGLDTITVPSTKTYDHSINLSKSLDNVNYDEGTMMWKFSIETGGQNLKESVNGYRLTDPIFTHLTQDDMSKIGFNLIDTNGTTVSSRFVKSDGSTTSTLGDDYGVQLSLSGDTITVRYTDQDKPICNKIQLYYYTNIEDYIKNNYGEDTLRSYQSGDSVTITNTATATNRDGDSPMTSTGTGTGKLQKRVEASKSRTGVSDDITYSLGGDDTTDKVLSWYVHLTNDSGFTSNTSGYVYTDELKSSNSNVQHMITATQWDEIVVYGSHDYYADYSALEPLGALVDKQKIAQDAYGNTTKFGIRFTGGIDALNYHHIYIVYKSTAKTSQIQNGSTVEFSNNYQIFDHDWQTADGLTYTRESPNPSKIFTIQIIKNWNDISNSDRPNDVTFKVYRVLADKKGPDGVLPVDPDWEEFGTYTMAVDGQKSQQMVLKDDSGNEVEFARWEYYQNDNSYQLYYYKIEEDPVPTGYTASGSGSSFIVRPSEQANFKKEQTITNSQLGEFKKTAIDYTGEAIVKQRQSELPIKTMTIEGERQPCYLIGWKLWMKMDDETIYEDTIPDGMYFVTGHEDGLEDYRPYGFNDGWKTTVDLFAENTGQIKITEIDSKHYTFKQSNKGLYGMVYYTAVPINKLDSVLDSLNNVTNTVKAGEETKSATLQIVRDVQENDTSIEKSFNKGISAGYLNYSIAINSDAKKYSNTGTIDITDNLFYAGGTKSAGVLSYVLDSVKVYPQKEDGTADKENPLNASEYSYTVEYDAPSKNLTFSNYGATGYGQGDGTKDAIAYRVTGWSPGDKIGISITRNSEVSAYANAKIVIEGGKFNYNGTSQSWYLDKKAEYSFESYQEITVPSDAAYIYVIDQGDPAHLAVGADDKKMIITALEGSVLSAAQLNLSVPDEKPLIVEYVYKVSGWEESDTLRFTNTASFDEDNGGGSSTSYDNVMQVSNSGGDVTTSAYPKIYKTNVNNYAINTLSATFKIAKYDADTNQWVYADSITVAGSGAQQHRQLHFPENALTECNNRYPNDAADLAFDEDNDEEKIHQFALEPGTLYKLVEIEAPLNYRSPDWTNGKTFNDNSEFVFYYAYDGYSGTIPTEAKGKVQTISNAGTINIPNSNMISLSAKKTFSGETLPTNASVTLKLYWANSKRADMSAWQEVTHETLSVISEGYDPERIITYSSNGENTATWNDLPSGVNGSPIYYFVKEESYTIDGVTYTYDPASGKYKNGSTEGTFKAVYMGNGTNTNEAVIEVDNSEGIIVKKIWHDIDGNVMESAPEDPTTKSGVSVNFTVYGYKNGTRIALNLPVKALTEANNYTYKLPDRVSDTDGNSYALSYFDNFEITETLTTHQQEVLGNRFIVTTTRKIKDGTGLLEITNTDTYTVMNGKLQVEKDWLKNDAGDTESITVELYRQAYNADGTPYVPPDTQQIQSSRSLPKGMFSMRRAQTALAEAQTDESTEVKVAAKKEILITDISFDNAKDVSNDCDGLLIEAIEIGFNKEVGGSGNLTINGVSETGVSPSSNTWYYEFAEPKTITSITVNKWGITWDAVLTYVKLYYTPIGPEITIKDPNRTIVKGDSFYLETDELSDGATVEWSSLDTTVAKIDKDSGEVTFLKAGTVTIKATATDSLGNTKDATIELTAVSGEDFEPSITPAQVHEGGTAMLGATKTGITWKIDSTASNTGEVILNGATVTATKNGTVIFVGNRGDTERTVTLEIVPLTVQFNGEKISSGNIQMNVLSSLPVNGVLGNAAFESSDNSIVYYDPDTQTIKAGENIGTATITITDNAGTAGESAITLTITTIQSKAESEIPSTAEKLPDITITKDNDWKSDVIDELPLNDGNGHNYRYFIKETSTGSYIPIAYTSNGLELSRYSTTRLALTNAVEETEPDSVELPESGSTGTRIYYTVGGILLLLSAAGYVTAKRRRWSDG